MAHLTPIFQKVSTKVISIRPNSTLRLLLTGLLLSLIAPFATAEHLYNITIIPTLPGGDRNFVNDVNNHRQVTGNSRKAGEGTRLFPYIWTPGESSPIEIGLLPNVPIFGRGFSINDSGVVVGESGNGPSKAFLWSNGDLIDLGSLPGGSGGVANAINNTGQVVGAASNGQTVRAWISDGTPGGPLIDLGTPLGTSNSLARAFDISNSGIVAGLARNASDTATTPTLWIPDGNGGYTPMSIATPAGGFGEFESVNDAGQAVGRFSLSVDGQSRTRALFHDGNEATELGLLASEPTFVHSRALGINNDELIVGYVAQFDNAPGFGGAAVIWQDGQIVDLNTLIPHDSGWTLQSAQGVNDHGDIVGFGLFNGQTRAFLLTPVPEPSAFVLLGLGALGAFGYSERRRRLKARAEEKT
ncbi:hypothetical protein BH23PLA1_BH23PLA1_03660 [soil metagenome]